MRRRPRLRHKLVYQARESHKTAQALKLHQTYSGPFLGHGFGLGLGAEAVDAPAYAAVAATNTPPPPPPPTPAFAPTLAAAEWVFEAL